MLVGLADLDIETKNIVELDLERADTGAFAFAVLDLRDELFAVAAEIAEFIQRGVDAGANDAAVVKGERRLVDDGLLDAGAEVFERVEKLLELIEARRCESGECGLRSGNL